MAQQIGIRELKNQVSGIVRRVREESAEYIITHHGTPVAIIRPIEPSELKRLNQEEALETWRKMQQLGRQLAESRVSELSPVEILEQIREEENQWPLSTQA